MSPRKYDSPKRRAASDATRSQILEAARALIGGKGDLSEFSMEAVAEKAGVARMTVYYQFTSKAGLLEALADRLASRGGMADLRLAFLEPDPERALRTLVETFARFWASDRTTLRRLRAMAIVSPGETGGPRGRDAWRHEAVSRILGKFEGLPDGARAELADLMATLTGFETYDTLAETGRTPKEIGELLARTASGLLHDRAGPAGGRDGGRSLARSRLPPARPGPKGKTPRPRPES
jgi:AcrR family transcriptional regulator